MILADGPSFGIDLSGMDVQIDFYGLRGQCRNQPHGFGRGHRCARRFLHDFAQLSGQGQLALSVHKSCLCLKHLTAHFCPGQFGCQSDLVAFAADSCIRNLERPSSFLNLFDIDRTALEFGGHNSFGGLYTGLAISRSRLRTPDSRVYLRIISSSASPGIGSVSHWRPLPCTCFRTRNRLAISSSSCWCLPRAGSLPCDPGAAAVWYAGHLQSR